MSRALSPTVFVAIITVLASSTSVAGAQAACPYPCLPPPTSGGMINSYPPPPPDATGGGDGLGGSYRPPPPTGSYQLTPPGVMPGYLAPPYSTVPLPARPSPPPPNPVLPWYPWYYQHENPITGSTTSASPHLAVHLRSTRMVSLVLPLCLVILLRAL